MSQFIWAKKGELKKKFDSKLWNSLKNKNGWVPTEAPEQVVEKKTTPPDSGNIANVPEVAPVTVVEEPVKNNVGKAAEAPEQVVENSNEANKTPVEFVEFVKKNLSKSIIKDFLDEKGIAYKNSMILSELTELLATHFENKLEYLKTAFNFSNDL